MRLRPSGQSDNPLDLTRKIFTDNPAAFPLLVPRQQGFSLPVYFNAKEIYIFSFSSQNVTIIFCFQAGVKAVKGEKDKDGEVPYMWGEKAGEDGQRTANYMSDGSLYITYYTGDLTKVTISQHLASPIYGFGPDPICQQTGTNCQTFCAITKAFHVTYFCILDSRLFLFPKR